ncbi:MAG: DUF3078 domain-containing protein [Bacteroidota bacterium]
MKSFVLILLGVCIAYGQTQPQLPLPDVPAPKVTMPPEPTFPDSLFMWKHTMIVSANITQVSFTDWAQGGENSLAYALSLEGKSVYRYGILEWDNTYKFGYGQAKLGTEGIRKTDDKIDLESVLTYKMEKYVNPYVSASLKTQFVEGVTYDSAGTATPVSNFFDPAYITQAAGIGYQPAKEVKTRLGFGLREIVTNHFNNYADGEKVEVDGGFESVTEVGWTVVENVVLNVKLELFSPLKKMTQMTVRSDNTISARVNKFLAVNFNIQMINDSQVQIRTQIKQTLALGINFAVI